MPAQPCAGDDAPDSVREASAPDPRRHNTRMTLFAAAPGCGWRRSCLDPRPPIPGPPHAPTGLASSPASTRSSFRCPERYGDIRILVFLTDPEPVVISGTLTCTPYRPSRPPGPASTGSRIRPRAHPRPRPDAAASPTAVVGRSRFLTRFARLMRSANRAATAAAPTAGTLCRNQTAFAERLRSRHCRGLLHRCAS